VKTIINKILSAISFRKIHPMSLALWTMLEKQKKTSQKRTTVLLSINGILQDKSN